MQQYQFRHIYQARPQVDSSSLLCNALLLTSADANGIHQANVFRHALIGGIPTWAVEYVSFDATPPTKHPEAIAHRIGQCPIVQTETTDLTDVVGYLNVQADPNVQLTAVTMADFQFPNGAKVQFYEAENQEILKLQVGQKLICQIRFSRNNDHAKHHPVGTVALRPVVNGYFSVSKSVELTRATSPWVIQNMRFTSSDPNVSLKLQDKLAGILGALPIDQPTQLSQIRIPLGPVNLHSLVLNVPDRQALDDDFRLILPVDITVDFQYVVNDSQSPLWRPVPNSKQRFTDQDTGYYFSFYTVGMFEVTELLRLAVQNVDRVINAPAPSMYNKLVV